MMNYKDDFTGKQYHGMHWGYYRMHGDRIALPELGGDCEDVQHDPYNLIKPTDTVLQFGNPWANRRKTKPRSHTTIPLKELDAMCAEWWFWDNPLIDEWDRNWARLTPGIAPPRHYCEQCAEHTLDVYNLINNTRLTPEQLYTKPRKNLKKHALICPSSDRAMLHHGAGNTRTWARDVCQQLQAQGWGYTIRPKSQKYTLPFTEVLDRNDFGLVITQSSVANLTATRRGIPAVHLGHAQAPYSSTSWQLFTGALPSLTQEQQLKDVLTALTYTHHKLDMHQGTWRCKHEQL